MRMLQPMFGSSAVAVPRSCIVGLALSAFACRFAFAQSLELKPLSTMATGIFNKSAAEITAYDPESRRLYVVNAQASRLDIFDIRHPAAPVALTPIDMKPYGAVVNSVDVNDEVVAVAIANAVKTEPGRVVFFNTDGEFLSEVTVGALPDMLTFTPNGKWLLVANEGEPNDDYTVDPEGSVSIIDVSRGAHRVKQADVRTADFRAFNTCTLDKSIRIFGPNASVAQDLEPENIAVAANSKYAWVTLQENNALALVDIKRARVVELIGLGFKDHNATGNGLDASDRDNKINIANWPVQGMYLPDGIARYNVKGVPLLVTANEGDARVYDTFDEEKRVGNVTLDPTSFPNAAELKQSANLGRLKITSTLGDPDNDGDFDALYSFGARSFSIWAPNGHLIFDSGDAFERITAAAFPDYFNCSNTNNTRDDRSDDKGPEPEGLCVGKVDGRYYAFIGLERIGGIMVFDISNPLCVSFEQYFNNRRFTETPGANSAGDLGPEGLLFIPADESPCHKPLLVVANEVSGSTTIYEINHDLNKNPAESEEIAATPAQFTLHQNYPNPFNPTTTIRYSLPEAALVAIKVYTLTGAEVATLVDEWRTAGNHEVLFNASRLASGVYFYRLSVNGTVVQVRQLTLTK